MKTGIWKQDILVMGESLVEKARCQLIQFCRKGWKAEHLITGVVEGNGLELFPPKKQEETKRIPH